MFLVFSTFVIYKQVYIPIKDGENISDVFEQKLEEDNRFSSLTEYLL